MINDEFKNLNVSRQRKYQLRKKKQGKCVICGKNSHGNIFCKIHLDKRDLLPDSHISSKGERDFLNHFLVPLRQILIGQTIVDGLLNGIIYEFLGDYWHGNLSVFDANEMNLRAKKTFGELNKETFERFDTLKQMGHNIKYVWEADWRRFSQQKDVMLKLQTY